MSLFADHYKGRRVFITGHTGFKGFWLTSWLLELGAEVAGFSLDVPTSPSGFSVLGLEKRIRHFRGDVRDLAALKTAFAEFKPEIVFHMAAQALVRPSYADPVLTFETNAMGTLNVLEAVRAFSSVEALVLITSDKCYRNDEWVWGYRENDHLGGKDPYSASKACAELIAHAYFSSFFSRGPHVATVRAGNVIGGGDWALDRIVPDCARAWSEGRPVSIRSPMATRPWQHVLEPLSGYLWLGACLLQENKGLGCGPFSGVRPCNRESFNFGPPADVNATVQEVVTTLTVHWPGFVFSIDGEGQGAKQESTLLKLCCDKALAYTGWKPALVLDESMAFTAEWYRYYYELVNGNAGMGEGGIAQSDADAMYAFTARQIAAYAAKAAHGGLIWTG